MSIIKGPRFVGGAAAAPVLLADVASAATHRANATVGTTIHVDVPGISALVGEQLPSSGGGHVGQKTSRN